MVDSKELKKEVLEIHFEEKEGDVLAYLGSDDSCSSSFLYRLGKALLNTTDWYCSSSL